MHFNFVVETVTRRCTISYQTGRSHIIIDTNMITRVSWKASKRSVNIIHLWCQWYQIWSFSQACATCWQEKYLQEFRPAFVEMAASKGKYSNSFSDFKTCATYRQWVVTSVVHVWPPLLIQRTTNYGKKELYRHKTSGFSSCDQTLQISLHIKM